MRLQAPSRHADIGFLKKGLKKGSDGELASLEVDRAYLS